MTLTTAHENHAEHTHDVAHSQRLGVLLLIIADAAFVFGLLFTYFYLRGLNTSGGWVAKGAGTVNPAWNWIIAAVVVASALVYQRGERRGRAGDRGALATGTSVGFLLLVVDLAIQLWRMAAMPVSVGTDAYTSTMMVMGGAHVFHLLLTLFAGLAIWLRARRGPDSDVTGRHAMLVGYWWTWVAASAVLIALATSFVSA